MKWYIRSYKKMDYMMMDYKEFLHDAWLYLGGLQEKNAKAHHVSQKDLQKL